MSFKAWFERPSFSHALWSRYWGCLFLTSLISDNQFSALFLQDYCQWCEEGHPCSAGVSSGIECMPKSIFMVVQAKSRGTWGWELSWWICKIHHFAQKWLTSQTQCIYFVLNVHASHISYALFFNFSSLFNHPHLGHQILQ